MGLSRRYSRKSPIEGSITHLKRRRIFGFHFAPIIDSRGGDIGFPKPFLDFGDVGDDRGHPSNRGAQRVGANLEAESQRISAHEFVDAVGGDRVVELAGAIVADGSK